MTSTPFTRISRRGVFLAALTLGSATLLPSAARAAANGGESGGRKGVTAPEITGCAGWGAREASEDVVVLATRPDRIIIHHTATANVSDYSRERAHALARAIQTYHMDMQGWIDTGQHFTVSRGAFVLEGRHQSLAALDSGEQLVRGAHCVGQNSVAVGIENEGTYMTEEPPAAQFSALADLCAHVCRQYGIGASEIYGHRDFNSTACPGDKLYAMLPKLRQDVARRLGDDRQVPLPHWSEHLPADWATDPQAVARALSEYLPEGLLDPARRH
ncbi:N-acetylmuramoyl-L-alanine amidase [Streptomyces sp. 3211.6]|uniref:peptidoglycan recognition protein family protein n=1 Tax=Streptomyces TaxID=1883 RepID=UPI0009A4E3AE|nr:MULTISPECIES: peptidoglycan recognition family protein [Streptomyces]RKT02481.1 N-acetylmuramoyl-L-alanine amidase [Streptomyces sp. 3211.6]RPF43803.1 N-acetylmuramoyl-L-alanine amidase [Streptomyces sp. Ag109_G2-6]